MLFNNVWTGIVFVPDVAAPVMPLGTLAVHVNETPNVVELGELSVTSVVDSPEQMLSLGTLNCTAGEGSTVTV